MERRRRAGGPEEGAGGGGGGGERRQKGAGGSSKDDGPVGRGLLSKVMGLIGVVMPVSTGKVRGPSTVSHHKTPKTLHGRLGQDLPATFSRPTFNTHYSA